MGKSNKMSKSKKIITVTLVSLLAVFLLYIAFCYVYKKVKYAPFLEASDKFITDAIAYKNGEKEDFKYEGYVVSAFPSQFFYSFGGNLAVTQTYYTESDEKTGESRQVEDTVDLMIWPKLFGGYKTGVEIDPVSGRGASFYVDEDMNLIEDEHVDEFIRGVYEKYKDSIRDDFVVAHEIFGIYDIE